MTLNPGPHLRQTRKQLAAKPDPMVRGWNEVARAMIEATKSVGRTVGKS